MSSKRKFTPTKTRTKEIVHLEYLSVYNEVLKYEDVMDIDLDDIYTACVKVIQRRLDKGKLVDCPQSGDIEILAKEVMDILIPYHV